MRLLNETLMWHIGSQVQELRKIVLQNKDVLMGLRTNFDKPDAMKELSKRLTSVDSVLQVYKFPSLVAAMVLGTFPLFSAYDYNWSNLEL